MRRRDADRRLSRSCAARRRVKRERRWSGRKFGLRLVTAAQSLASLGVRLRDSILTNAGVLGVLSPGPEDAQLLRRLFAPLTVDELLGLRRFELLLRMPGVDGRNDAYGGMVCPPPPGSLAAADAVVLASNSRDARPVDQVRAEVHRRAGGDELRAADASLRLAPTDRK